MRGADVLAVRADARRTACLRHRSLHEACLESTTRARVVELVAGLDTDVLAAIVAGGEGSKSAMLVCTCEGLIDVFDHEDSQGVSVGEGTRAFGKSKGRKK